MISALLPFTHTCQIHEVSRLRPTAPCFSLRLALPSISQIMAACHAVHAVVAADVSITDAVAVVAGNTAVSAPADEAAADEAPHTRLLPHLLAISNIALALRLNSKSHSVNVVFVWSFLAFV
jgi:hypothetical protein